MTETKYGIIRPKELKPFVRGLLVVPHRGQDLTVGYPPWLGYFKDNVAEMQKLFFHPQTGEIISFREPTTPESISAAGYDFENLAKPRILDAESLLHLGYVVRISEGVFANPPKDEQGNPIVDEQTLKSLLSKTRKINGIYLADNDFGFAPYETFIRGDQDSETFVKGGLARILEHTEMPIAERLANISSPKFHSRGVNIMGFDEVIGPILGVVGLKSTMDWKDAYWLDFCDDPGNHDSYGITFGVLK